MAQNPPAKSPLKHSTHSASQIAEAQGNLKRSLEAYDGQGEEGLRAELDRLYQADAPSSPHTAEAQQQTTSTSSPAGQLVRRQVAAGVWAIGPADGRPLRPAANPRNSDSLKK
ncbi:MAG: hypothetical protein WDO73_25210 [Ignavibacteriota bacterium]